MVVRASLTSRVCADTLFYNIKRTNSELRKSGGGLIRGTFKIEYHESPDALAETIGWKSLGVKCE